MVVLPITLGDPLPTNHPISTFHVTFYSLIVSVSRNFKIGRQVDYSKSQPTDDKPALKGP